MFAWRLIRSTGTKLSGFAAGLAVFLFALASASTSRAAEVPARPNIVVILVDDLRWDALSSTGHPFVKTPNIDRIANEGARFRNAFVTTPLCLPSRASILTGQYAHTHGITGSGVHLAREFGRDTFPVRLQQAGYETAYFGKWHTLRPASRSPRDEEPRASARCSAAASGVESGVTAIVVGDPVTKEFRTGFHESLHTDNWRAFRPVHRSASLANHRGATPVNRPILHSLDACRGGPVCLGLASVSAFAAVVTLLRR